jgi:hypothetical protein
MGAIRLYMWPIPPLASRAAGLPNLQKGLCVFWPVYYGISLDLRLIGTAGGGRKGIIPPSLQCFFSTQPQYRAPHAILSDVGACVDHRSYVLRMVHVAKECTLAPSLLLEMFGAVVTRGKGTVLDRMHPSCMVRAPTVVHHWEGPEQRAWLVSL